MITSAEPAASNPYFRGATGWVPRHRWPLAFIGVLGLVALALTFQDGRTAYAQDLLHRLAPPAVVGGSWQHPLGTDNLGRDVFARVLLGARYSFALSTVAVGVAGLLGLLTAAMAAYFGGTMERLFKLALDVSVGLPAVVLAIAVIAALGTQLWVIALVLAATGWPTFARVLFSAALKLRVQDFVVAAEAMGASGPYMVLRVFIPNLLGFASVIAISMFGRIVGIEAALSFIGLGVQVPSPSWGNMLADSRLYLSQDPWFAIAPGLALFATVVTTTFVGTRYAARGAAVRRVI